MDQLTFHPHALRGDLSLKEAAIRMKNPVHPGELVAANLKDLGLSVADAAKAIGVTRQRLYNVINGRSTVTPAKGLPIARRWARARLSRHAKVSQM